LMKIFDGSKGKMCISEDYNFIFDKVTGQFARWGKTKEDDPVMSIYGPEILDLEISDGTCLGKCKFCYKSNGNSGLSHHMTLDEFKIILDKMPKTLTQIAFGLTDCHANPDFIAMMEYSRSKGIIPNYTTHGLDVTKDIVEATQRLCGAVAVSIVDREKSYDAIKAFTDAGMNQTNIHYMLSEETYQHAFSIVEDISSDPRLSGMRAIVFLQYKAKGRHTDAFNAISDPKKYKDLIEYCDRKGVSYGFDSCSAPLFFTAIADDEDKKRLAMYGEPCESALFSSYINCRGFFFPCSFSENEGEWTEGIDVLNCDDFVQDVWMHDRIKEWRDRLIPSSSDCVCEFSSMCRSCPIYEITACKKG